MVCGDNRGPVILIADDEVLVRNMLAAYLKCAGYEVVTAAGGSEALSLFERFRESLRLVVTDVEMPDIPGLAVADIVEASGTNCRVLLMSGNSCPEEAEHRGWAFLAKPFSRANFLNTVGGMLADAAHPPARPRLLLAEDDGEVRVRLCRLLAPVYDVVAALERGAEVLDSAKQLHPEVILLDISMPGMNGFIVARLLRTAMPAVPLVFVTQHSDPIYVAEAFASGGSGYVLKRNVAAELIPALEEIRSGGRYLSSGLRAM